MWERGEGREVSVGSECGRGWHRVVTPAGTLESSLESPEIRPQRGCLLLLLLRPDAGFVREALLTDLDFPYWE